MKKIKDDIRSLLNGDSTKNRSWRTDPDCSRGLPGHLKKGFSRVLSDTRVKLSRNPTNYVMNGMKSKFATPRAQAVYGLKSEDSEMWPQGRIKKYKEVADMLTRGRNKLIDSMEDRSRYLLHQGGSTDAECQAASSDNLKPISRGSSGFVDEAKKRYIGPHRKYGNPKGEKTPEPGMSEAFSLPTIKMHISVRKSRAEVHHYKTFE